MNEQKTSIGDRLKSLISDDIQERTGSDLPPMIGAFSLVAEYTDATGRRQFLSLTDESLPPWQELGLLETRLSVLKARWPGKGQSYREDN